MLEVTIRYSEYDNKIVEARTPLNSTTTQLITINQVPEGMEGSIRIDIIDNTSENILSTKTYTRNELLGYIKLLSRLQKEITS